MLALPEWRSVLTPDAIAFVNGLAEKFSGERARLLALRESGQREFEAGKLPDFPEETRALRAADWRVGSIPQDLMDRRVEITGPPERKMVINALNSGANVFMADFEDSLCPTWANLVEGQANLMGAVRRDLAFTTPEGKSYRLNERTAVLVVRPRGWHLPEKHWLHGDEPIAGAFMDFGLYLHQNAAELLRRGTGPYFYLPKLENQFEARLWADVIAHSERALGLPPGTVKVTVLIETITAAFEIDEILHELRDSIVGLNCGRWDYIFSFIKKLGHRPGFVLPDRGSVTMASHFLRSYSQLVIQRCHRRGAFAMGGMAAQIPIKNDPDANARALARVRADKEREAGDGHDGTWVAHPGLVPVARDVFDRLMPGPNNMGRMREDVEVTAADLLRIPEGQVTRAGLRTNIDVGVAVPRGLARRQRLRTHPPPDGGRGDRRDFAGPALAMGAARDASRGWDRRHARPRARGGTVRSGRNPARDRRGSLQGGTLFPGGNPPRPADGRPRVRDIPDPQRVRRHRLKRERT